MAFRSVMSHIMHENSNSKSPVRKDDPYADEVNSNMDNSGA